MRWDWDVSNRWPDECNTMYSRHCGIYRRWHHKISSTTPKKDMWVPTIFRLASERRYSKPKNWHVASKHYSLHELCARVWNTRNHSQRIRDDFSHKLCISHGNIVLTLCEYLFIFESYLCILPPSVMKIILFDCLLMSSQHPFLHFSQYEMERLWHTTLAMRSIKYRHPFLIFQTRTNDSFAMNLEYCSHALCQLFRFEAAILIFGAKHDEWWDVRWHFVFHLGVRIESFRCRIIIFWVPENDYPLHTRKSHRAGHTFLTFIHWLWQNIKKYYWLCLRVSFDRLFSFRSTEKTWKKRNKTDVAYKSRIAHRSPLPRRLRTFNVVSSIACFFSFCSWTRHTNEKKYNMMEKRERRRRRRIKCKIEQRQQIRWADEKKRRAKQNQQQPTQRNGKNESETQHKNITLFLLQSLLLLLFCSCRFHFILNKWCTVVVVVGYFFFIESSQYGTDRSFAYTTLIYYKTRSLCLWHIGLWYELSQRTNERHSNTSTLQWHDQPANERARQRERELCGGRDGDGSGDWNE